MINCALSLILIAIVADPVVTLDRQQTIDFLVERKAFTQCVEALGECENRECEQCKASDETPAWLLPVVISGAVAIFLGGVALGLGVGCELAKPR